MKIKMEDNWPLEYKGLLYRKVTNALIINEQKT